MRIAFVLVQLLLVAACWCQGPFRMGPGPVQREVDEYRAAVTAKDYKKALEALDRAEKRVPASASYLLPLRLDAMWLMPGQQEAALAFSKASANGAMSQNSNGLNGIAWSLISSKAVLPRTYYKEGIRLAQRAVTAATAAGQIQTLPYALDTLALGYYKYGDLEKALSTGQRALQWKGALNPRAQKEVEERVELFRAALRKKH